MSSFGCGFDFIPRLLVAGRGTYVGHRLSQIDGPKLSEFHVVASSNLVDDGDDRLERHNGNLVGCLMTHNFGFLRFS